MSNRNVVACQLYKRLSQHYTQTSITLPYSINLTTIIRAFGLTAYERLAHNLRDIELAVEVMKEKYVILTFTIDKTLDAQPRNIMIEATIIVTPHPEFVGEVMQGNKKPSNIKEFPCGGESLAKKKV